MDDLHLIAEGRGTEADLKTTRLGARFGRMDLASQLALLAVEPLAVHFSRWDLARIGICLAAAAGSLSTDIEFWKGRATPAGPSPTLFAYTLPSAAMGEMAIRHRLTGPGICMVGGEAAARAAAADMLRRGECAACLCVYVRVITPAAAVMLRAEPGAVAEARLLELRERRGGL